MVLFAEQMVILACVAAGAASLDSGCNCEAACAEVVKRQRREIARLQAEVRALRGSSEDANAVRRTATAEQAGPCNSTWELNSDADVESLANKSCHAVQSILIGGSVTSLIGLESLETAEEVLVSSANFLKSLTGLESLQSVGSFLLHGNFRLKSLTKFENLHSIGTVSIWDNPRLTSLAGLENLTSVSSLVLRDNDKLESLEGLQNLGSVTALEISRNDDMKSLAGLENLGSVTTLEISFNGGLESLAGLESLDSVTTLEISSNWDLESLAGLENLHSVSTLEISSNWDLESLAGLENLHSVTTLEISFNLALGSLAGLENLHSVTTLEISSNRVLGSLAGLENLGNVTTFEIASNYYLQTLAGLENLRSADTLEVSQNDGLQALSGLESLRHVSTLKIGSNRDLKSLAGLQGLDSIGTLELGRNDRLESLAGLENLESIDTLIISNHERLSSLSGLENLTSVSSSLRIDSNWDLSSLLGLRSLQTAEAITISDNALETLTGLESLRTAGAFQISGSSFAGRLSNLTGLNGLRSVRREFKIHGAHFLVSLDSLENLRAVGSFSLESLPRLTSLAGLRSLAYAWGGITILNCNGLTSLQGLGSLYRTGQFSVQGSVQMKVLGGPFAVGAHVSAMYIDKAVWPRCVTPHERTALLSAVAHTEFASIPNSTWQEWRDNSCGAEIVTCTKGHPCNFSLVDFGGGERVFVSEPTQGCGACSDVQLLQANVSIDGMVDLGYLLKGEEGGHRSICRCGAEVGPATQLFLRGPVRSGVTVCRRGHNCTLKVNGGVEATDHVTLMSSCSQGNPLLGVKASWAAENLYLLHVPATWYAAAPVQYQVCWRAPCSSTTDGPVCPSPEGGYFHVGEVELIGPSFTNHTLILGEQLLVPNVGFGVSDGDWMILRRACGEASEEDGLDTRNVKSSGLLFDFGRLTEDHVQAGSLRLCWCQEENGVQCTGEADFTVDAGAVQIVCPAGQELVSSGRCRQCPAGKQRLEPGLEACLKCPAGLFSPGGTQRCEACPEGTVAELVGSSACAVCQSWESASAEAARCSTDPGKVIVLVLLFFSVGAFSSMLVWVSRRRLPVVDVSLHQGRTIITILGCHGFSNFGGHSFPVTLCDTGHAALDSPSEPLRARVEDGARVELLSCAGKSIVSRMDTSRGTLAVAFPNNLYHRGRRVPAALSLPLIFITLVILFVVAVTDMAAEAVVGTVVTALICTVASAVLRSWPRATPLTRRLSEFKLRLQEQPHSSWENCDKGPACGISIGQLHELLEFFRDFIRGRNALYLENNILWPLTRASGLSYAELVGAGQAEWFVSHCWGTAFEHLCVVLRKHAEVVCGQRDWTTLHYWISFCSNNEFQSKEGLGANWKESPVHLALQSGECQGTCMVLDDQALPLTRIWCVYELLQTLRLERNDQSFQGLLFCTSSGVLNMGSGSVEAAMALAEQVVTMDLTSARATSTKAEEVLRAQILQEVGPPSVVGEFVRREVQGILVRAQENSYQQFAAVLAHLQLEGAAVPI